MKNRILFIALIILLLVGAFIIGREQGIQYTLDNQYIETLDCTHDNANFDYGIYLDERLVRVYE